MASSLSGKTVFVTGGTGFVGGRLIERLIRVEHVSVRALVRNYSRCARLARFDLQMVPGDLKQFDHLDQTLSGCDTVFHCAHDFSSPKNNLVGLRNLLEASSRGGVRRFVYISSMAVYEPLVDGDLTEETAYPENDWEYAQAKRAAEVLIEDYAQSHDLEVVVLQPCIVYGPFSQAWTDASVLALLGGGFVLPEEPGVCNPVYVDDLVTAILLAATQDGVAGERFLISGPDSVPWREFYGAHAEAIGRDSLIFEPDAAIRARFQAQRKAKLRSMLSNPVDAIRQVAKSTAARNLVRPMLERLSPDIKLKLQHFVFTSKPSGHSEPRPVYPDLQKLVLYQATAAVRIDKARELLGYTPVYSFNDGMRATKDYIAWAFT